MTQRPLHGKVALITGASRGIGRATAKRLAAAGADVIINYLTNEASARDTAEECRQLGSKVWMIKADVGEEEDIAEMIEFAGNEAGAIDLLISNAASGGYRELMQASARNFDTAMHINARPLLFLTQYASRWLIGPGKRSKIVAISSHGSHRALPAYGVIGASKAALESLVRQLAYELGPQGVHVNCILAGLVATDATQHVDGFESIFAANQSKMLVGEHRVLRPEDVAESILFLCSEASDFVQGHTMVIDGGVSLHL